jgi:hypothetical protein
MKSLAWLSPAGLLLVSALCPFFETFHLCRVTHLFEEEAFSSILSSGGMPFLSRFHRKLSWREAAERRVAALAIAACMVNPLIANPISAKGNASWRTQSKNSSSGSRSAVRRWASSV